MNSWLDNGGGEGWDRLLRTGQLWPTTLDIRRGADLQAFLESDECPTPLQTLFAFWAGLRDGDALPSRSVIDPTTIPRDALPYIVLIDVERSDRLRFRYRLVGTEVTTFYGRDYTGRYMDEVGLGDLYALVHDAYALSADGREPVLLDGDYATKTGQRRRAYRLALPLSNDGATVDCLLCPVATAEVAD